MLQFFSIVTFLKIFFLAFFLMFVCDDNLKINHLQLLIKLFSLALL